MNEKKTTFGLFSKGKPPEKVVYATLEEELEALKKEEWDLFAEMGRQIYEQNKANMIFPQQADKLNDLQLRISTVSGQIMLNEREKRKNAARDQGEA